MQYFRFDISPIRIDKFILSFQRPTPKHLMNCDLVDQWGWGRFSRCATFHAVLQDEDHCCGFIVMSNWLISDCQVVLSYKHKSTTHSRIWSADLIYLCCFRLSESADAAQPTAASIQPRQLKQAELCRSHQVFSFAFTTDDWEPKRSHLSDIESYRSYLWNVVAPLIPLQARFFSSFNALDDRNSPRRFRVLRCQWNVCDDH
jgi:hypothetical protein